ncbi:MAG TPA: hypothetical protein VII30_11125 [Gemmatimonadaceae bacterium]
MKGTRLRIVAVAAFACVLTSLACSNSTAVSAVGKLSAKVVDANNVGIQGANADLYKLIGGGALLWRASSTSSDGIAVFGANEGGVIAGDYYIHVSFITNNQLAAGETNDKQVTVKEGDDLVVTFHAVSTGPGL